MNPSQINTKINRYVTCVISGIFCIWWFYFTTISKPVTFAPSQQYELINYFSTVSSEESSKEITEKPKAAIIQLFSKAYSFVFRLNKENAFSDKHILRFSLLWRLVVIHIVLLNFYLIFNLVGQKIPWIVFPLPYCCFFHKDVLHSILSVSPTAFTLTFYLLSILITLTLIKKNSGLTLRTSLFCGFFLGIASTANTSLFFVNLFLFAYIYLDNHDNPNEQKALSSPMVFAITTFATFLLFAITQSSLEFALIADSINLSNLKQFLTISEGHREIDVSKLLATFSNIIVYLLIPAIFLIELIKQTILRQTQDTTAAQRVQTFTPLFALITSLAYLITYSFEPNRPTILLPIIITFIIFLIIISKYKQGSQLAYFVSLVIMLPFINFSFVQEISRSIIEDRKHNTTYKSMETFMDKELSAYFILSDKIAHPITAKHKAIQNYPDLRTNFEKQYPNVLVANFDKQTTAQIKKTLNKSHKKKLQSYYVLSKERIRSQFLLPTNKISLHFQIYSLRMNTKAKRIFTRPDSKPNK